MENRLSTLDWVALVLVIIGGLNWGLVGIFDYNLVAELFNGDLEIVATVIYALVGLSALYLAVSAPKLRRE